MATSQELLQQALVDLTAAAECLEAAHIKVSEALALLGEPVEPEPPVINPPDPPEPQPKPPVDSRYDLLGRLPEAKRLVPAPTSAALAKALMAAQPGDRIILDKVTYDTAINLNIDGQLGYPIIIHAPNGATLTGLTKISGKFCGVSGVTYKGDGRKVEISDVGARVLRCLFDGIDYDGSIYMVGDAHPLATIDYCKFSNFSGAAIRSEIRDGSKHRDMMFACNHFLNHKIRGDNESVILILMDGYNKINMTVYRNRFEKCGINHETLGQSELESFKTTGNLVDGNTIVGSPNMNFSLRVCSDTIVQNNWFRDGAFISVQGDDHVIQNNDSGSAKLIEFYAGNCTMDTKPPEQCKNDPKVGRCPIVWKGRCAGGHAAPRRCLAQNNRGVIKVGSRFGSDKPIKVQDLTLVNNSTKASVVANSVSNLNERGVGQNTTTAREMTAAMVGPDAPAREAAV